MFLNSSLCEGRTMAHQWPSFLRPESQETSFARRLDAKLGSPITPPEMVGLRLQAILRDAMRAGRAGLDARLRAITEAARKVSEASSDALALGLQRRDLW